MKNLLLILALFVGNSFAEEEFNIVRDIFTDPIATIFWSFFLFHLILYYILERELFNKEGKTSHGNTDHIFWYQVAISFGWTCIYFLGVGLFYLILSGIGYLLGV